MSEYHRVQIMNTRCIRHPVAEDIFGSDLTKILCIIHLLIPPYDSHFILIFSLTYWTISRSRIKGHCSTFYHSTVNWQNFYHSTVDLFPWSRRYIESNHWNVNMVHDHWYLQCHNWAQLVSGIYKWTCRTEVGPAGPFFGSYWVLKVCKCHYFIKIKLSCIYSSDILGSEIQRMCISCGFPKVFFHTKIWKDVENSNIIWLLNCRRSSEFEFWDDDAFWC